MTGAEYSGDDWIDRLASALRILAKEQEPWLKKYYDEIPFVHVMSEGSNGISLLYSGEDEHRFRRNVNT